jgi:hypothetical protein
MRRLARLVCLVIVCLLGVSSARGGASGPTVVWDVRDANQAGQLLIYNADTAGCALGEPVGSGDLDGDGYADVVTCAFYGPGGPSGERRASGKLHLWHGGSDVLRGGVVFDAEQPAAPTAPDDFLGCEVDVGDVNGDGLADILACAQNSDGFGAEGGRDQAGSLYVILGRAEWPASIDLAASPDGVVQVLGAHAGDRCGFWAAHGDLTGDGVDDVLVSADLSKGPNGTGRQAGAVYVIPGGAALPARIDLDDEVQRAALGVTAIYGVDSGDHLGASITAGRFDDDGHVDLAIGAGLARSGAGYSGYGQPNGQASGGADGPDEGRPDAGQVYVLFGRDTWPASIQLADEASADMALYYGDQPGGSFGEEVRAGDFDGDGRDELAVGALTADPPGRPGGGIGYVFWSDALRRGSVVDVRAAGPGVMTTIYGQDAGDIAADTLLLADVDADGLADMLFGSPTNSPPGRPNAGDLKVMYGSAARLPAIVDTASPSVPVYRLLPADPGDLFTYSVAVGDVDGDGVTDLVPNVMAGDGNGNRFPEAGDAVVISGRALAGRVGRGSFSAPELSGVSVEPALDRYYAGQMGIVLTLHSDATDPERQFREGAEALVRGVEVPTQFLSPTELRVRLDDAPDVRNASGPVGVQARNPGSEPSAVVDTITLVGPSIRKARLVRTAGGFAVKVKGGDFLEGATLEVVDAAGAAVPVTDVVRKNDRTLRGRVAAGALVRGTTATVRVLNPGPAPSAPATARVP